MQWGLRKALHRSTRFFSGSINNYVVIFDLGRSRCIDQAVGICCNGDFEIFDNPVISIDVTFSFEANNACISRASGVDPDMVIF